MSFMNFLSDIMHYKYAWKKRPTLCVLRYQGIAFDKRKNGLMVTAAAFEEHLFHLTREKYTPMLLSQLEASALRNKALPDKPVLITFDKGGRELYTQIYPLLRKYKVKANIFLTASLLTKEGYLTLSDIRNMDGNLVEFGLNSFSYRNYSLLSPSEIEHDIICSKKLLTAMGIHFQPAIAFPYGNYPKRNRTKKELFFLSLAANDILLGFCINNKVNILPLTNPLLIKRVEVKPGIPLKEFARLTGNSNEY